ncbi:hypothetical protein PIB30_101603 [Stylosanthes scabra]|uniref:Uncharacterized protein n=1 Tax=Stylosanthes scabra TaxID=79078 RepID=A0ABU6QYK4_9FABA|nr:hypothetical protein [Stylosanthes scabra]
MQWAQAKAPTKSESSVLKWDRVTILVILEASTSGNITRHDLNHVGPSIQEDDVSHYLAGTCCDRDSDNETNDEDEEADYVDNNGGNNARQSKPTTCGLLSFVFMLTIMVCTWSLDSCTVAGKPGGALTPAAQDRPYNLRVDPAQCSENRFSPSEKRVQAKSLKTCSII